MSGTTIGVLVGGGFVVYLIGAAWFQARFYGDFDWDRKLPVGLLWFVVMWWKLGTWLAKPRITSNLPRATARERK